MEQEGITAGAQEEHRKDTEEVRVESLETTIGILMEDRGNTEEGMREDIETTTREGERERRTI